MNEIEALRQQVSLERRHMAAVKAALTAVLEADGSSSAVAESTILDFCERCVAYLVFIMRRFGAQDRAHVETLLPRLPADADTDRHTLNGLSDALRINAQEVDLLAAARELFLTDATAHAQLVAACRRYVAFYDAQLRTRKHGFYELMDQHYGVAEWRRVSMVNADSILQERRLFATVRERMPEGVMIGA